MAPQLAVALHHRQRLAQLAARDAEDVAQLAFRRKTGIGRQIALRQVGAHLRQSTLSLIHAGSVVTWRRRSEEHTSELQSLMRISYAVFCLKKKKHDHMNKTKEA